MPSTIGLTITDPQDVGERADVVLGRRVSGLSRRAARALAQAGALWIDRHRASASTRVLLGMRLELTVPAHEEPTAVRIVACSEAFVYIDKPAGVHTHRLRPDDPPSVADAVARVHPECAAASPDPREGGAIHRLDRETTGVVAFARGPTAWAAGRTALAHRGTIKLYVAVCERGTAARWVGRPAPLPCPVPSSLPQPQSAQPLQLDLPLGRADTRAGVRVRADGRITRSTVLPLAHDGDDRWRLVAVWLHTGYRHQARVHLAHLGWPIVGDARYGGSPGATLLHCALLDLRATLPDEPAAKAPAPAAFALTPGGTPWRPWADDRAP